ncbi:MAG: hypothetical protein O2875_00215 [Planctomycetota bacterium]|nr:hypothetical protein [Planctomycetota bacterium]MDA1261656.1 hypothetical protein [Planctomycetota bacterium]
MADEYRNPSYPPPPARRRSGGCCGCSGCGTFFVLALLAAVIYFGVRSCDKISDAFNKFSSAMTGFIAVQTTVTSTLVSALGDLHPQGGLLVGWREIDTRVKFDRETTVGVFGYKVPVGSVSVLLEVPGNRAQYIIPSNGPNDEHWNAQAISDSVIMLTLPAPIVNDKVVEVQSDPGKMRVYIDNDWMEHLIPSGGDIDQAKKLLRQAVIETAQTKPALAEVRIEARQVAGKFFSELFTRSLGRSITVLVQFADEIDAQGSSDFPK